MDLEQQLRESYAARLGALDPSTGDVGMARRAGLRMRLRRRILVTGAAGAVVALALAGLLSGRLPRSTEPAGPVGHWRQIPSAPLSQRALALGVWTGHEVLYLGGERRPCAPIVSCDAAMSERQASRYYGYLRDGAAYDPGTNTWRPIAPAPGYVEDGSADAFAAGRLYVDTSRGWFSYDVATNTWSPFVGRWSSGDGLSAVGDVIYGLSRSGHRAVAYDAGTSRWTTYPPDALRPRLGGPTVVGTPSGPVLGGYSPSRAYDVHRGSPAIADAWDGHGWRRLPQTGQMERGWVWTGRRLVDPTIGYQDRGDEDRWPKAYPYGGILDPASGAWSPLPDLLEHSRAGWQVVSQGWPGSVGGGDWFVVDGRVYDDETGKAWPLPRPSGAPASYTEVVWADGRLVAFGGADYSGQKLTSVTAHAWLYTP